MNSTYILFLSDDGIKDIGSLVQQWTIESHIGTYIKCNAVNTSGSYIHIEISESNVDGPEIKYEMELAHRHVKLIITGSDITKIGFLSQ